MALFGSASAAAAVVGVIADTWPVARAPHSGETLRRCGAYNRRTKSTAPVPLKARVRHAFRSTRQSQRMNQLRSQHAMHVEVSLRECRKRKAILQLFSRATCLVVAYWTERLRQSRSASKSKAICSNSFFVSLRIILLYRLHKCMSSKLCVVFDFLELPILDYQPIL